MPENTPKTPTFKGVVSLFLSKAKPREPSAEETIAEHERPASETMSRKKTKDEGSTMERTGAKSRGISARLKAILSRPFHHQLVR